MSIEKLSVYGDFQAISVPDGYDEKSIPDLTRDNLIAVIEKQNEIIDKLNEVLMNGKQILNLKGE